ncbi:ABC transporter substrate-binding protein [Butyrivibrio sp. VCD2006]|uniref:ABC transporter substrate-binding protein n=1 Tax=Butyrivibrio sp. VCD2006 TaxID=1280664 RepID=UPI000411793D|nr:ABC transporter substrate-binding protein [Butyrivibrio sp. VCD2006]
MKKKKVTQTLKKVISVLGIVTLLSGAAACGGQAGTSAENITDESAPKAASTDDTVDKLRIGLVTSGAVRPALVVAAQELGYYKEEGLDVEFVPLDDSTQALAALSAGKLEVWPYAVVPSLSQIAQGNDLVIYAGTATEGSSMVKGKGNEDVDFRDYNNWVGKKIAYSPTSTTYSQLLALLKENGIEREDVDWVEIPATDQVLEALKKGTIDAGFLTEEFLIVGEKAGLVEAFQLAEVLGNFVCCRQTANQTYFNEHQRAFKKLLRAQTRALVDYRDDTSKVVEAVAKFIEQDNSYVERYIATPNPIKTGAFAQYKNPVSPDPLFNNVSKLYQSQIDAGLITPAEGVELKDHFNISLFEEAVNELIEENPDVTAYKDVFELFKTNNSEYGDVTAKCDNCAEQDTACVEKCDKCEENTDVVEVKCDGCN